MSQAESLPPPDFSDKVNVSDPAFREKLALEDIKKIHGEINQYINHSFLLTTSAIATFGVGVGWIASGVTKSGTTLPGTKMDIVVLSSSLMTILIAFFFVGSRLIENNLILLVTYLREKNWSDWEWDMHKLREGQRALPYFEENYFRRVTMLVLVVMTPLIPIVPAMRIQAWPNIWILLAHILGFFVVWVYLGIFLCQCGCARKKFLAEIKERLQIPRKDILSPVDWSLTCRCKAVLSEMTRNTKAP